MSCKNGPLVSVCLSYPVQNGFICVDKAQKPFFVKYADSTKFVAFSPDDAQLLIESCGIKGSNKEKLLTKYESSFKDAESELALK